MAIRTDAWISLVHVLAPAQHVAVSGRACAQAESTARQHRVRGSARGSVRDRARQSLARLLAAHASGATHIGQRRGQPYTAPLPIIPAGDTGAAEGFAGRTGFGSVAGCRSEPGQGEPIECAHAGLVVDQVLLLRPDDASRADSTEPTCTHMRVYMFLS